MSANGTPLRFGIIGTGWRAGMFLAAARAIPQQLEIVAALSRSDASADRFGEAWRIAAGTDRERFFGTGLDAVILCVTAAETPGWVRDAAARGVPALVETPLALETEELFALDTGLPRDAVVEVAEQYRYQPQHAARIAVAASGLLGTARSAQVSAAHYYHGVSLLRAALGVGFEDVRITAASYADPVLSSLGRGGWEQEPFVRAGERVTARLEFPERAALGVYEFDEEQYFSPIRTRHVRIAGERGELVDDAVNALRGPGDPITLHLQREETGVDGDLDGRFLRRITLGERILYENPVAPARLSDDEIAIATVLLRMADRVRGGASFYGVADAAEDQYLSLLIRQALALGTAVRTEDRPWLGRTSALQR